MKKAFIGVVLMIVLIGVFTACDGQAQPQATATRPDWPSAAFDYMARVPMFDRNADSVSVDETNSIVYISYLTATYEQTIDYVNQLLEHEYITSAASSDINLKETQLSDGIFVWTSDKSAEKPSVEVYYYDLDVARKSNGESYKYSLIIKISES